MIINYPGKYTDLKRVFNNHSSKIMHIYKQEINNPDPFAVELSCPDKGVKISLMNKVIITLNSLTEGPKNRLSIDFRGYM
jgi:hypothetical protein